MTLCELLMKLKSEKGGTFEVFINRSWDLPTFNYDTLFNTIDEWIDGFSCADVWWSDRSNDEDGDLDERHAWEMDMLFSEAELIIEEEGPYGETVGQWINVDF